ncbi:MAG: hypothetical protein YK1312THETA_1540001 [Marine Group I thaumarchaeote]|nr:MAG: hypothetical protein YK1312THETA_1540001 [Marine Group I thaumarchaeote]
MNGKDHSHPETHNFSEQIWLVIFHLVMKVKYDNTIILLFEQARTIEL